jgi:lipopolysaccharide transport system ATP-binding protein
MPLRFLPEFVRGGGGAPDRRSLPRLIIPGAMKAGTTSLFAYLEGHPQLAPSLEKEVHYFDMNFHRGPVWYARQFPRGQGHSTVVSPLPFESSPYYLFDPRVPARIRELVPDVKLVILLRDPVDRAFSHYHNNLRLGRENLSFEDAIDAEEERIAGEEERLLSDPQAVSLAHKRYSYLRRGLYAEQLLRWQSCFPEEQLLLVDAGRLFTDPRAVVAEVLAFVGVDPWEPPNFAARNEGRHGEAMQAATRSRLEVFYEPHEQRLSDLIGWCPSAGRRRMAA